MESMTIDLLEPVRKAAAFVRRLKLKQDPAVQSILFNLGSNPAWTRKDIARLTEAGYQNCTTAYACVREITDAAAGVPWILEQNPISSEGRKIRIDEHDLLELIHRPNPRDGGAAFIRNLLGFYLIAGNSYIAKVGPNQGPPKELYLMRPDRMKVLPGTRFEPIGGYQYTVSGNSRTFKKDQVLHMKMFHPLDDWYGLSPIEVAAKEIDISSMAREWNMKLLQNDCKPPGALTTEGALEEEQRTELKKMLREDVQGYNNAATPLVLEGGLKWEAFAITPKDMDHFNSDKMTSRKICSVFNVAPELIGDSESKTFANYKEARKALYLETVMPHLDYMRDEYNNWLTPLFGDRLRLDYDRDSIEAIREELSAVYERMSNAYWLTVDEKRVACGKSELKKGGDVVLIPANLTPLDDISGNIKEE